MKSTISRQKNAIFYTKKLLDNHAVYECCAFMTPLHEYRRTSYTFTVTLTCDGICGIATAEDVTVDRNEAEHIFNLISNGIVYPCHLFDVISDLIV